MNASEKKDDTPVLAPDQQRRRRPGRRPVMVRFAAVLLRVPRYLRLAYRLARDERLTPGQRALAAAGVAYAVSPIDPIPGIIPVVGQLDDLAVLLLGLRQTLRSCPPHIAAEHLQDTGVSFAAIDADLAAIRATAIWVAATTGRAIGRAAGGLARAGRGRAGDALARLGSRLRRPSAPATDATT